MKVQHVVKVCFSPTYSTQKMLDILAGGWEVEEKEIDLTDCRQREQGQTFEEDTLVYFAVPSYGGRIPAPARTGMKKMRGNQTPAVIGTTFGNRAYDDVLLEMKNLLEAQGFRVIAAVAAVTEHNIVPQYGTGRPDEKDQKELAEFARRIRDKVEGMEDVAQAAELEVCGNEPYREYNGIPLKPHADQTCKGCGVCAAKCPVGAIPTEDPSKTDKEKCISCMRCIRICPSHSRSIPKPMLMATAAKLKKACAKPKKNELML